MLSVWITEILLLPAIQNKRLNSIRAFWDLFLNNQCQGHNFLHVSLLEYVVVLPFEFICDSHWSISAFLLNIGTFRYVHIAKSVDKKVDFSRNYTQFSWGEEHPIVLWTGDRNVDTDQKISLVENNGNREQ